MSWQFIDINRSFWGNVYLFMRVRLGIRALEEVYTIVSSMTPCTWTLHKTLLRMEHEVYVLCTHSVFKEMRMRNEVGDHVCCFIDSCRVRTGMDSFLSSLSQKHKPAVPALWASLYLSLWLCLESLTTKSPKIY